jgi:tetratricopeptide (TPR) repeat protein
MPSHVRDEDPEAPRPTQISIHEEQVALEEQAEGLDTARPLDYKEYEFDLNSLDVVGSPRLTKLLGFLAIEECDDIDDLDLAGGNLEMGDIWSQDLLDVCSRSGRHGEEEDALGNELSTSTSTSTSTSGIPGTSLPGTLKTSRIIGSLEKWTKKWFQYEIYPFPTSQSCARFSYDFSGMFPSRGSSQPKMSPSQCKRKLRALKLLEHVEIIHLLEAMGAIAHELYYDRHYVEAEFWFRRIVTTKQVKQLISWHNPQQTLLTCVFIIRCMAFQGRTGEAHQHHDTFHDKIERVLGADHVVACFSRELKGFLLGWLGFKEEGEGLCRQHLQICLTTFGTTHPRTVSALQELGRSLDQLKRHTESQRLLETAIHFQLQKAKVSGEIGNNKADILLSMTYLARGLNRDMKYDESEAVLDCAQKLLGDATRTECETVFEYHYIRASNYILQKQLGESEKILRSLLRYHEKSMLPNTKANFMWKLAEILMEMGRESEAAYWLKKRYILNVEAFDPVYAYTMASCWSAGFCYARQGRHDEARLFFGNSIEALTSSTAGDNSRLKCIQEINAWMLEVEEMRAEDPMPRGSVAEDSERMDLDIDSDDYWREIGDVPDLCPLQYP